MTFPIRIAVNPFLGKFYQNPSKYALETELAFVLIHYHQILHEIHLNESNGHIADFCISKDLLFAEVNLDGGTIIVDGVLTMTATGSMDITGGTLIVDGDVTSTINTYISNIWITAYDRTGTINMDYDDTNSGKTTLTATEDPLKVDKDAVISVPDYTGTKGIFSRALEKVGIESDK